jgi:hypothetical protein
MRLTPSKGWPQDLRIQSSPAGQLLRMDLSAIPITVQDRPQAYVRSLRWNLVTQFLKRFADPRPMRSPLPARSALEAGRRLFDSRGTGSELTAVNHMSTSLSVHQWRQTSPSSIPIVIGMLEVLCGNSAMSCCAAFFMGNSLFDLKDLLIHVSGIQLMRSVGTRT